MVTRSMRSPVLFRRRQVWVPTLWGGVAIAIAVGVGLLVSGSRIHGFLAPNEPVGGARVLVVEGWLSPDELDQALATCRSGGYPLVLTTGGPIAHEFDRFDSAASYAERARSFLVLRGLPADGVIAVPAPATAQDRSFQNALMVREWATLSGVDPVAIDVFSSGVHGRRSRALHRLALGTGVRVGILSSRPSAYDPETWWRTSAGTKEVLTETIAWLWTALFFQPGPTGPG